MNYRGILGVDLSELEEEEIIELAFELDDSREYVDVFDAKESLKNSKLDVIDDKFGTIIDDWSLDNLRYSIFLVTKLVENACVSLKKVKVFFV